MTKTNNGLKFTDNDELLVSPVDGAGNSTSNRATTLGQGSKAVTSAGTAVQLSASSVPCKWVTVEAYRSNTGFIAVGGSSVLASAAGTGATLASGDPAYLEVSNLNIVYIDASVSAEGVRYTYGV